MFIFTGDMHGDIDIHKFSSRRFPFKNLTKDDYVIICGDFGLIWNSESSAWERHWLKWLEAKPWTTLFIDGNHENHTRLDSMPVEIWNGGKTHRISDSIIHLMRGQVFTINNTKIFTMGGAASHDKSFRKENVSWWSREMPSEAEYTEAIENLQRHDFKVDYVITHCAPTEIQACIDTHFNRNDLTEFFSDIYAKIDFNKWFCGHYHFDARSIFDNRFHILYNDYENT